MGSLLLTIYMIAFISIPLIILNECICKDEKKESFFKKVLKKTEYKIFKYSLFIFQFLLVMPLFYLMLQDLSPIILLFLTLYIGIIISVAISDKNKSKEGFRIKIPRNNKNKNEKILEKKEA